MRTFLTVSLVLAAIGIEHLAFSAPLTREQRKDQRNQKKITRLLNGAGKELGNGKSSGSSITSGVSTAGSVSDSSSNDGSSGGSDDDGLASGGVSKSRPNSTH